MTVITFIWTIKGFEMCPQPAGQPVESPCFSIDAERTTKFSLILYPRGKVKEAADETYVSLYLKRHFDGGKEEIDLTVYFYLIGETNVFRKISQVSGIFIKNEYIGSANFIERKCLIGPQRLPYFSKSDLTVHCCIYYDTDEDGFGLAIHYDEDYDDLSSDLGELLKSGSHSDISIEVRGKKFKAHRVILESRCPRLMEKLQKLEDSNTYSMPIVDAATFQNILQYLYTGSYGNDSNLETVLQAINNDEVLKDLKSSLFLSPREIQATTEIIVHNVTRYIETNYHYEDLTSYLFLNETPEWSWVKMSLIKAEDETGFKYTLKFKRLHQNDSILFMQCDFSYFKDNKIIVKKLQHLFENKLEWTTPIQIEERDEPVMVLNVRVSACALYSIQSEFHSEKKYIREYQEFSIDSDVNKETFQKHLQDLHRHMKNSDVTLRVGSQEISAHKAILSCRFKVFSKMFEHDTKENRTGIVDIEDVDESAMTSLVMYMYCGDFDDPLLASSAIELYTAAEKYEVLILKYKCREYLEFKLTVDNVGDVLSLAAAHQDDSLKQICFNFITSHSDEILKDEACLNALKSRFHLYPDILDALLLHICQTEENTSTETTQ